MMHQDKLIPQLLFGFDMGGILQNRIGDRADFLAGWRFVMTYTLGAFVAVNLVNAVAH